MSDTAMVPRKDDGRTDGPAPLIDEQLADQLLGRAQAEGVELLGPDGLLSQVTKAVLERAQAEEMTGHLGYEKHDPAGRGSGNSRNGTTGKTLLTDVGAVDLQVPRDPNGSFEPQIARKGQTRLQGSTTGSSPCMRGAGRDRPARLSRIRAAQRRQHRERGPSRRVAAAANPQAATVVPGWQVQPYVPAAVTASCQPRAPAAQLPASDRINASAPPVHPSPDLPSQLLALHGPPNPTCFAIEHPD